MGVDLEIQLCCFCGELDRGCWDADAGGWICDVCLKEWENASA